LASYYYNNYYQLTPEFASASSERAWQARKGSEAVTQPGHRVGSLIWIFGLRHHRDFQYLAVNDYNHSANTKPELVGLPSSGVAKHADGQHSRSLRRPARDARTPPGFAVNDHATVTAQEWYACVAYADVITHLFEPFINLFYRCNMWHARGRERSALVDDEYLSGRRAPGCPADRLPQAT